MPGKIRTLTDHELLTVGLPQVERGEGVFQGLCDMSGQSADIVHPDDGGVRIIGIFDRSFVLGEMEEGHVEKLGEGVAGIQEIAWKKVTNIFF